MSNQAIKEYLIAIGEDYKKATKREKTIILNEAQKICNLSRKQIIRKLKNPETLLTKTRSGSPPKYPRGLLLPYIRHLWISSERMSARRLQAAFDDWVPEYKECPAHTKLLIMQMSVSTLERFLKIIRNSSITKHGLSTTCPARFMKNKIPLNTFDRKINRPGFTQADTVAHCGNSAAGQFINSLTLVDIDSTWTEIRALYTKKALKVRSQIVNIEASLPFRLLAINFDSGSEFLNNEILNFGRTVHGQQRIVLTRSRPYKKNDNCYVEQRNYTQVRELFGYERMEEESLVELMNEIYTQYWGPLQNFFLPHFKLKEKYRVGSKIVKKYDRPQTAYKRLMNSSHLTEKEKESLKEMKTKLNPFELKAGLEKKLKEFFGQLQQFKIRKAA